MQMQTPKDYSADDRSTQGSEIPNAAFGGLILRTIPFQPEEQSPWCEEPVIYVSVDVGRVAATVPPPRGRLRPPPRGDYGTAAAGRLRCRRRGWTTLLRRSRARDHISTAGFVFIWAHGFHVLSRLPWYTLVLLLPFARRYSYIFMRDVRCLAVMDLASVDTLM